MRSSLCPAVSDKLFEVNSAVEDSETLPPARETPLPIFVMPERVRSSVAVNLELLPSEVAFAWMLRADTVVPVSSMDAVFRPLARISWLLLFPFSVPSRFMLLAVREDALRSKMVPALLVISLPWMMRLGEVCQVLRAIVPCIRFKFPRSEPVLVR